ncbi:hypothetical protein AJ78_06890 [Emergomyces pasteurianus Ep9510]|uniref:Uncharacterized protein n=1 Tax=Emergomyces pasteurianus Ep9510 TaxID=1447872 RepID=A0A1J9QBJ9_9EURO|nr:hypothetical protein AJ78_06890 [Emergomyces pasteurianus Ep9510]
MPMLQRPSSNDSDQNPEISAIEQVRSDAVNTEAVGQGYHTEVEDGVDREREGNGIQWDE